VDARRLNPARAQQSLERKFDGFLRFLHDVRPALALSRGQKSRRA
jgi:hypothetical protein